MAASASTWATVLGLKALYVAVIGGLNSLARRGWPAPSSLGFFEAMWSGYFPSEYRDVASFLALTFLLIARPKGSSRRLPPDQSRLTR